MQLIDRYAYSSRIRMVDPAHKLGLTGSVILLCLVLDKPLIGLIAVLGTWALASRCGSIPARVFGGVLAAEAAFLAVGVLGVALSFSPTPSPLSTWGAAIGPWWVGTNPESLGLATRLLARALGCAAAMNFLALTTPLVDLMEVMRRLRLPPILIDLMALVYRFVFTLVDSLARMRTAQESRLGYVTFGRGMASAGLLAGGLFADACRRTVRVQTALESRCYDGEMKVLPLIYRRDRTLYFAGATMFASLIIAWSLA